MFNFRTTKSRIDEIKELLKEPKLTLETRIIINTKIIGAIIGADLIEKGGQILGEVGVLTSLPTREELTTIMLLIQSLPKGGYETGKPFDTSVVITTDVLNHMISEIIFRDFNVIDAVHLTSVVTTLRSNLRKKVAKYTAATIVIVAASAAYYKWYNRSKNDIITYDYEDEEDVVDEWDQDDDEVDELKFSSDIIIKPMVS